MTERFYKALEFAIKAHDGQYDRGGNPYVLHPLFLSSNVLLNEDEKIVALFHDIVEDTNYSFIDIANLGYEDLVYSIDCITKRKGKESYEEYINRVCSDKMALKVKIGDMLHNSDMSRLKEVTGKDKKMIEKYEKWLPILEDRLLNWKDN